MHAVVAHIQILNSLADVQLLADCNHASRLREQMFHCRFKLQQLKVGGLSGQSRHQVVPVHCVAPRSPETGCQV
jgi:hypothetical protein